MTNNMNVTNGLRVVFVVMALAFVGLAASGAVVTDSADTYEVVTNLTHTEVGEMPDHVDELMRSDRTDNTYGFMGGIWRGLSKGSVLRSRVNGRRFLRPGLYVQEDSLVAKLKSDKEDRELVSQTKRQLHRDVDAVEDELNIATEEHKNAVDHRRELEVMLKENPELFSDGELKQAIVDEKEAEEWVKEATEAMQSVLDRVQQFYSVKIDMRLGKYGENADEKYGSRFADVDRRLLELNPDNWTFAPEHEAKVINLQNENSDGFRQMMRSNIRQVSREFGLEPPMFRNGPRSYTIKGDGSVHDRVVYRDRSSEEVDEDTRCYGFETNLPVSNLTAMMRHLDIYYTAQQRFHWPGHKAPGQPSMIVDLECGWHLHISVAAGLEDAKDNIRKIRKLGTGDPTHDVWVDWQSAFTINYHGNLPVFGGMMGQSRDNNNSHNTGYAKPQFNRINDLRKAKRLYELAKPRVTETAQEAKDRFTSLAVEWRKYDGPHAVGEETMSQLEKWDGATAIPERVANRLLKNARKKYHEAFWAMVDEGRSDYWMVNFGGYTQHGTVEVRHMGGLNNWFTSCLWMITMHKLMIDSMDGKELFIASQHNNGKHEDLRFDASQAHALAQFLCNGYEWPRAVQIFLDVYGITDFASLNADAVNKSHLEQQSVFAKSVLAFKEFDHWQPSADFVELNDKQLHKWRHKSYAMMGDTYIEPTSNNRYNASLFGVGLIGAIVAGASPVLIALACVACGIGGWINMNVDDDGKPTKPSRGEWKGILRILAELSSRGSEACGVAYSRGDGKVHGAWEVEPESKKKDKWGYYSSGINVPKMVGSLMMKKIAKGLGRMGFRMKWLMTHTRHSTGGANDRRNAHPIKVGPNDNQKAGIVLTHNGMISFNAERKVEDTLPEEYFVSRAKDIRGLELDTRCIVYCLDYYGSTNDGIDKMAALCDFDGRASMRLVWVDKSEACDGFPERVHLWANCDDLWVAQTVKGNWVYASTQHILKRTFGNVLIDSTIRHLDLDTHYVIDWQHGLINLGKCGNTHIVEPVKRDSNAWRTGRPVTTKPATVNLDSLMSPKAVPPVKKIMDDGFYECRNCENGHWLMFDNNWDECQICGRSAHDMVDSCSSPSCEPDTLWDTLPNEVKTTVPPVGSPDLKTFVEGVNAKAKVDANLQPVEAVSAWQKEFDACPCPTGDDHDFSPVSPCEGSATYKANNKDDVTMRKCNQDCNDNKLHPHERDDGFGGNRKWDCLDCAEERVQEWKEKHSNKGALMAHNEDTRSE